MTTDSATASIKQHLHGFLGWTLSLQATQPPEQLPSFIEQLIRPQELSSIHSP